METLAASFSLSRGSLLLSPGKCPQRIVESVLLNCIHQCLCLVNVWWVCQFQEHHLLTIQCFGIARTQVTFFFFSEKIVSSLVLRWRNVNHWEFWRIPACVSEATSETDQLSTEEGDPGTVSGPRQTSRPPSVTESALYPSPYHQPYISRKYFVTRVK